MRTWLNGLLTAAISGITMTAGAMVIDPEHFNTGTLKHLGMVALAGALIGVLNFLRQSPLPKPSGPSPIDKIAAAIPLVCLLALPLASCARPVTITTPQGQAAYTADQIVVRINELQNTAIAANQQQQLGTDATRTIVQFCVGADATLAQTPAGWQTTLITAWGQLRAALPPISNPAVAAALATVDAVMGTIR